MQKRYINANKEINFLGKKIKRSDLYWIAFAILIIPALALGLGLGLGLGLEPNSKKFYVDQTQTPDPVLN